jgi:hypothetical protein
MRAWMASNSGVALEVLERRQVLADANAGEQPAVDSLREPFQRLLSIAGQGTDAACPCGQCSAKN